jgi:hypothetical protein
MEPNTEHRIRALGSSLRRQRDAILARSAVVASAGLSAATRPVGSATFDNVTCKEWVVVDQDGKPRIGSRTHADGTAGVQWIDKDEKTQIDAATSPDGAASISWLDKEGMPHIYASKFADGCVILPRRDLKE